MEMHLPPRATLERSEGGWKLSLRHRTVRWTVLLVFAVFWNAFIWAVILPGFRAQEIPPGWYAVILVLFPFFGLLFLIASVIAVFGSTVIQYDGTELLILSGLGSFRSRRAIPWREVRSVSEQLSSLRSRNAPPQKVISIERAGGKPIRFGLFLDGETRAFALRWLNEKSRTENDSLAPG